MKSIKILMSALLMVSAAAVSTAQVKVDNVQTKVVHFGIKGGANFSKFIGGSFNTSPIPGGERYADTRTNFHAGVFVEVPISDMFSLQVEGLYSGQGYELRNINGTYGDNAEVKLDYVSIPVLAKIYVAKGLSIEAGPQMSYLVNDKLDYRPNIEGGEIDLQNTRFEPNHLELAIAGGITFQTEMGLFATGRYTYGVTKLYDNERSGEIAFDGLHNQVFQVGLGFKF